MVETYREDGSGDNRALWIERCRQFMLGPERPAILDLLDTRACVVLHGSTTRNVADAFSDLDFYLILDEDGLAELDATGEGYFIDVEVAGKVGHLNVITWREIDDAFTGPDFELLYELQHGVAMLDPDGPFAATAARAQMPMSESVRRAGFMYNYVEMRRFHRSADNPMDRHDRWAALSSVMKAGNYALRCARVVDGLAYPYDKWLFAAANQTPTGRAVLKYIDQILTLLAANPAALDGPESDNRISSALRTIRLLLIDRAEATGINEPWLRQWWRALDEQRVVYAHIQWPDQSHHRGINR